MAPANDSTANGSNQIRIRAGARFLPPAAFVLFLATAVGFQWVGGAFRSEFSDSADEPAHYVTGLMVRDYLAAGIPWPPMRYAENYYLHYPKVALGHWPPFFYLVQAAWTLLFSPSRVSVLLLVAVLAAMVATTLFGVLRKEFSVALGVAAGLFVLSVPTFQTQSRAVMSETLETLLAFWAVLAFGRYLETERWREAAWFGLLASLCLLTKGTGITLALVPLPAVFLARRSRLLARISFWLPALMVLALCGPWYLLVRGAQHEAVARYGGSHIAFWTLWMTPLRWFLLLGAGASLLFLAGLWAQASRWARERRVPAAWAGAVSYLAAVYVIRLLVPAFTTRHLVLGLPMLAMFVAAGAERVMARVPGTRPGTARGAVLLALAVALQLAYAVHATRPKDYTGFMEVARDLTAKPEFRDSAIMVVSGELGEGMLVSEVAMREKRPGHIVLRAGKMLARSSWMGDSYQMLYQSPAEVMGCLANIPVALLVVDGLPETRYRHQDLVLEMLRTYPERWRLARSYPRYRNGSGVRGTIDLYRLVGHEGKPPGGIRIEMPKTLGRTIGN